MEKATTLQQCVFTLDTGALNNDNFDLFYTLFQNKYRTDIVKKIDYKLKTLDLNNFPVQSDKKIYSKFILAGHRGVGKSTELLRVSKLCRGYETVFVDAEAASGQESTEYTNLLVLIAEQIMKFGVDKGYLDKDDDAFEGLLHYWRINTNIKGEINSSSMTSSNVDEIVHTVINKNDKLFIGAMNSMISKLQAKMGDKRLLLIIEELDKAGQFRLAEEIFIRKLNVFTSIECDIIFTYPVHLLYDPNYAHVRDNVNDIFTLGVIELLDDEGYYISDAVDAFKELIYKRIDEGLIEERALEKAIKMSGGLIRDAFTIISEAAMNADIDGLEQITMDYIMEAIKPLEDRYSKYIGIKDGYDKVAEIVGKPYLQIDDELRELLRAEVVLEYSQSRYFVHPIVINFLKKTNRVVKEYRDR